MAAPDLEVIKEIPGYKVIMKAVLKSQIQQLVEQLATTTDEESVILTASVADGTLSHLGSESGKHFLEDHEDIKSQFLGFCLKRHHKQEQEKLRQETEAALQQARQANEMLTIPQGRFPARSPRFTSPPGSVPFHQTISRSPRGGHSRDARHEPYPVSRPRRLSTEVTPGGTSGGTRPMIKIEPNIESNEGEGDSATRDKTDNLNASSVVRMQTGSRSESNDNDDDVKSESSSSTMPNEPTGHSLDSELSGMSSMTSQQTGESAEVDPNVSVKLEAITEGEMDLEITGVEPGKSVVTEDSWDPNNFDIASAIGNQGDMAAQGYSSSLNPFTDRIGSMETTTSRGYTILKDDEISFYACLYEHCGKKFGSRQGVERHVRVHTREKPFKCSLCPHRCSRKDSLKVHENKHLFDSR